MSVICGCKLINYARSFKIIIIIDACSVTIFHFNVVCIYRISTKIDGLYIFVIELVSYY